MAFAGSQTAFLEAHPGLAEALRTEHKIVQDIKVKFQQYNSLSDKQVALVFRLQAQARDNEEYERDKKHLIETTITTLEKYLPGIRAKIDHVEASTPRTFHHYTQQMHGATFCTKFEGLKVSMDLPKQVPGLFHAGSVGIIMSGWLGAINYGVIVANEVESFLYAEQSKAEADGERVPA